MGMIPVAFFVSGGDPMCLRDLLTALRGGGLEVTEAQIRWAIKTGKVARPPLDGSLRFAFGEEHLRQLREHFTRRSPGRRTEPRRV
jgi:hypothetical protein